MTTNAPKKIKRPELSEEAKRSREPFPISVILGALHDKIHHNAGKASPARVAKVKAVVKERGDR